MREHVVIIGRPNVGKSTIFNRIIGRRKAIEHRTAGTTRDRNENLVTWKDREFILVDTGGWAMSDRIFSGAVKKQLEAGLDSANFVLFVVDGKDGLHPLDREIHQMLRKKNKEFLLVVNKIDTPKDELKSFDFYSLGVGEYVSVSAQHGTNIPALMEKILHHIQPGEMLQTEHKEIRVILVGKPNVGKSSLVNVLSKEERSIVHEKPGTTREAFDITIERKTHDFVIIDTPGLHRHRKFRDDLEYLSSLSTRHAIERADVAVLVADASQGIGDTESKIGQLIIEKRKGCLIVVNKWDLAENKEEVLRGVKTQIENKMKFLSWAEVLLVSAKTGQRTEKILEKVESVYHEYSKKVSTEDLREVIRMAEAEKPLSRKGHLLMIRESEQVDTRPPVFMFGVNDPELVHFSYKRFLENRIREHFGFSGSPVYLKFHQTRY